MWVALTFSFLGMLRQTNLAPSTPIQFDRSRHTCHGDVIQSPPGLLIFIRWSTTNQTMATSPVLPIPAVPGRPANPVSAYHHLISASPSSSSLDHPLLSNQHGGKQVVVTVPMLASALSIMLRALDLDPAIYSLHSL